MQRYRNGRNAKLPGAPAIVVVCTANMLAILAPASVARAQPGDMNCDGVVGSADVPLFVEALLGVSSFGGCDVGRGDMNGDSFVNALDTQGFIAALLGPACSGGSTWCSGVCTNTAFDPMNCGGCGIECDDPNMGCCSGGICQSCR